MKDSPCAPDWLTYRRVVVRLGIRPTEPTEQQNQELIENS